MCMIFIRKFILMVIKFELTIKSIVILIIEFMGSQFPYFQNLANVFLFNLQNP
jgi:hypothetical protein